MVSLGLLANKVLLTDKYYLLNEAVGLRILLGHLHWQIHIGGFQVDDIAVSKNFDRKYEEIIPKSWIKL